MTPVVNELDHFCLALLLQWLMLFKSLQKSFNRLSFKFDLVIHLYLCAIVVKSYGYSFN